MTPPDAPGQLDFDALAKGSEIKSHMMAEFKASQMELAKKNPNYVKRLQEHAEEALRIGMLY